MWKPSKKFVKRMLRVVAFTAAAGLSFTGAGNWLGFAALESAVFGAIGSLTGLVIGLLFNFALDGVLSDDEFDANIRQAVETVQSKTKKDK
jgi:predicted lysophospholipase L1 biosynthesis ABC-type transport system permease subunit